MDEPREIRAQFYAFSEPDPPLRTTLRRWWRILWTRWRLIVVAGAVTAVVATGASLLVPDEFEATATALPADGAASGGLAGLILGEGALSGLSLEGDGVQLTRFPAVATSRSVLDTVLATTYEDGTVYGVLRNDRPDSPRTQEKVRSELARALAPHVDSKAGIFELSYRHRDGALAATVVNSVLERMDRLFHARMRADVRDQLATISTRLAAVQDSLRLAEERLRAFREENRAVAASPALQLEEGRLMRDVEIFNSAYMELIIQRERVKVQEAGRGNAIQILDHAVEPLRSDWPPRAMWIVLACLLVELTVIAVLLVSHGSAAPDREEAESRQSEASRPSL